MFCQEKSVPEWVQIVCYSEDMYILRKVIKLTILLFLCILVVLLLKVNITMLSNVFTYSSISKKLKLEVQMSNNELENKINISVNNALSNVPCDIFPRNIVEICNSLGIIVQETNEFDDKISGLIYKNEDNYYILINASHSPERKSFTIAHELGHFYLHKDKLDSNSEIVSPSKSRNGIPILTRAAGMTFDNKIEHEANNFAAEILMPREKFLAKCDELNAIEDVAEYFGVSVPAASVRANIIGGWYFL